MHEKNILPRKGHPNNLDYYKDALMPPMCLCKFLMFCGFSRSLHKNNSQQEWQLSKGKDSSDGVSIVLQFFLCLSNYQTLKSFD